MRHTFLSLAMAVGLSCAASHQEPAASEPSVRSEAIPSADPAAGAVEDEALETGGESEADAACLDRCLKRRMAESVAWEEIERGCRGTCGFAPP